MRQWIYGITAASLLSCLAMVLCPPGRVKGVTRLVCGLMCALAVTSPLLKLDTRTLSVAMASYDAKARSITQNAEQAEKMKERTYIEQQYAAYILAKATEAGADLSDVSVGARWDDEALVWYPWDASLDGTYSAALSRRIEADLGIPAERQDWSGHE